MVAGRRQLEEAQLTDLHPRMQHDRQRRNVAQLQRHVTGESRVDETGSGMGQQAETSQRGLALDSRGDIVRERDRLVGRAEHELPRVQDKGFVGLDLDQPGQVGLVQGRVDDRILVVIEEPEVAVESEVDTGWLHHLRIPGLQGHPAGVDLSENVTVREQHADSLAA